MWSHTQNWMLSALRAVGAVPVRTTGLWSRLRRCRKTLVRRLTWSGGQESMAQSAGRQLELTSDLLDKVRIGWSPKGYGIAGASPWLSFSSPPIIGASLVNLSIDRDAITVEDHSFERKVFIDGLTYLLRGLPPDLNACEEDQIRSALPSTMGRQCCTHGEQNPSHGFGGLEQGHGRPALQVVVQKAVVTIVLMYCVLLTLLIALCKLLVRVERKHRISQRLVSQGIALAVSLGRQSESALVSLGEMNDGKVGRTLMGAAAWMVDNVTQGIRDGVGQSLEIITSQSIE